MERFIGDIAQSLAKVGIPAGARSTMARRIFSEVETALTAPQDFSDYLSNLAGRYRDVFEAAIGRPVERLLVAPVPNYLLSVISLIAKEIPCVTLADNGKAGQTIDEIACVTLAEAMSDERGFDAVLLGTVDPRIGTLFRDQLPEDRTVAACDLALADPVSRAREPSASAQAFQMAIRNSSKPLLYLSATLDRTLSTTFDELKRPGFEVFILTRRQFSKDNSPIAADPAAYGGDRHLAVNLSDMLWLVRQAAACPVIMNYARFFHSDWDLRNTIPCVAYSRAVLAATAGPCILLLYDVYQASIRGLEAETLSFPLYRNLLAAADGILVNADVEPVLRAALSDTQPILSLLRYGPSAEAQPEPDPGPFTLVMISNFISEWYDPTRDTAEDVRCLLRQGIEIHYYSSTEEASRFAEALPADEARYFHLHNAISDQRLLVQEISRYHAGWFVPDMSCCDVLVETFQTPLARHFAKDFVATTLGTACILYGCAGLPSLIAAGHYGARLFPTGTAFEVAFEDVPNLGALIDRTDWPALRRIVFAVREQFSVAAHIAELANWLDQFYDTSNDTTA